MSDVPFGFSNRDDDPDRDKRDDQAGSGANNPFAFGMGASARPDSIPRPSGRC